MNIKSVWMASCLVVSSTLANAGDLIFANGFEAPTGGSFTVGGSVAATGLQSFCCLTNSDYCLILQNNGGDDLQFADTQFEFATPVMSGQPYNVTVLQAPLLSSAGCAAGTQSMCSVTNGSGTIGSQNVTNVQVTCQ